MRINGIFTKVFVYTVVFSALLVGATAFLFFQQLQSYYAHAQIQAIVDSYQQVVDESRARADITIVAQRFYERNESFQFFITNSDGQTVYKTPNVEAYGILAELPPSTAASSSSSNTNPSTRSTVIIKLDNDYNLHALRSDVFSVDYGKWVGPVTLILAAMLAVCVIGAYFFARQITKPIKSLVDTTNRMSKLQDVKPLPERKDELGLLADDVYAMYNKLKQTIHELEDEILQERELEETQRYFFSAASHELKTPVAATSVLLEGMLANVGDYKDHPKYLRECLKLIDAQNKTIAEILETVKLSDGKIMPVQERLDIGRVIAGLLPDFVTLAETGGLRIIVEIPDGQTCMADQKMLSKALGNIILNAIQNSPSDEEIRIWCEAMPTPVESYRLCILNTGVMVDSAVLPKLFDPFYRVDKARSRKDSRSGLGLTIVQKTLESMDIDFALQNVPEGVLFWLELPQA